MRMMRARIPVVINWLTIEFLELSVSNIVARMAPGLAIEGMAKGKTAVSWTLLIIWISPSGLLFPKIISTAKINKIIPPETWNAGSGTPICFRRTSPTTIKNTKIVKATKAEFFAILFFSSAS